VVNAARMRRFAHEVQRPEAELRLDRAALLLGELADADPIDLDRWLAVLDDLADAAGRVRAALTGQPFADARAIGRALFDELGFRGNRDDYYDPSNSYLHEVLARRVGIPITLSVVYLEVARRRSVRVVGVGFPGHFLVRAFDEDRSLLLDPFEGGAIVDRDDLQRLLSRSAGPDARVQPTMLAAVSKTQILTRMLVNLAGIYGQRGDLFRSLEILERLHLLDAGNGRLVAELEQLRRRCEALN
jgi:regulator of sirC expression with transglutaminase-like and TPR domain